MSRREGGFGGRDGIVEISTLRALRGGFAVCYESGGDGEKGRAAGCGDVEREEVGDTCVVLGVVRQAVRWELCLRR